MGEVALDHGSVHLQQESSEESANTNKKPPWDHIFQFESPTLNNMVVDDNHYDHSSNESIGSTEHLMFSKDDLQHSIKKFEELSRALTYKIEGTESSVLVPAEGEILSPTLLRRQALMYHDNLDSYQPGKTVYSNGSHSDSHTHEADHNPDIDSNHDHHDHNDHHEGEEERSKSDGETEEIMREQTIEHVSEEERSKSDSEKDRVREEETEEDDAVPLRIEQAKKLNKLSLSNCWLKVIPPEVWDLTHVVELDLSANYIKKVSKSIASMTQLKRLCLNHNQLNVLPKEIWGLTNLTTLFLNNNSLKVIPKDVKNLCRLKTLDLSSNQINEISVKEGITSLTALVELRLRNNLLVSLPPLMSELPHLQVLWLEGNPMQLPKSILKKPAPAILAYLREHPNSKRPSIDGMNTRGHHQMQIMTRNHNNPPLVAATVSHVNNIGKKDINIIAEKELKKRKREQLEEMRKHLEVEKKVKLLEHELMLANAKALKYEEEARKVQEPVPAPAVSPNGHLGKPPFPPFGTPNPLNQSKDGLVAPAAFEKPPVFEWEIPLSEMQFGPRIGRGGYGEVYKCQWNDTEVAVKSLFTDNLNARLMEDLRKEVDLLCKLRHPNILLFMGACTEPETPCIVTEYLPKGSLAHLVTDQDVQMAFELKLQIAIDCARGMAYLHSRNPVIIHRDLKTDNLLVDDNWQVKVADFGLATVKSRTFAKTMCGTTGWTAPEVLNEEGYTEKADVYSYAIILWELFTRKIPYAGKNTMQVVRSVDRGERLVIPEDCPPDYAELITECWNTDPSKRPAFSAILRKLEKIRADCLKSKLAAQTAAATGVPAPADVIAPVHATTDPNHDTATPMHTDPSPSPISAPAAVILGRPPGITPLLIHDALPTIEEEDPSVAVVAPAPLAAPDKEGVDAAPEPMVTDAAPASAPAVVPIKKEERIPLTPLNINAPPIQKPNLATKPEPPDPRPTPMTLSDPSPSSTTITLPPDTEMDNHPKDYFF